MATFATDTDLLEYEPDIQKYGIAEFDSDHEKTYDDIIRLLNIRWFPKAQHGQVDISVIGTSNQRLSPSMLTASQFKRAAVYHVLAYYIYPKLSKFEEEIDVFERKMNYYKQKFEEEFDLILRLGVEYDLDSSGDISEAERQPFHFNRLVR
jgi:hypothetical protein